MTLVSITYYAQKTVNEQLALEGKYSDTEIQAARLGATLACTTLLGGAIERLLNGLFSDH
ncbi:hypothetical protein SGI36_18095 [Providencia rettgeri]|uniref:hypothetical protein n=1 Tax=Providencia TaxID=586 RepID=UPI001FABCC94|nr:MULTISPECIES: hypothetical protein [Providencia]MCK9791566.1 hypothetical protein [Providencia rettgeri]MDM9283381.1 hypothetical protein [Providencia rettgeri]MDX7423117.1 hypothetical protein [Providencia sp. CIM-Carb-044]